MLQRAIRSGAIDRVAILLSGLCLVHCLVTALLLGSLSALSGLLGDPLIHEAGLVIAILLGTVALGRGALQHQRVVPLAIGALGLAVMAFALTRPTHGSEALVTIAGVALLAIGHVLNRPARA